MKVSNFLILLVITMPLACATPNPSQQHFVADPNLMLTMFELTPTSRDGNLNAGRFIERISYQVIDEGLVFHIQVLPAYKRNNSILRFWITFDSGDQVTNTMYQIDVLNGSRVQIQDMNVDTIQYIQVPNQTRWNYDTMELFFHKSEYFSGTSFNLSGAYMEDGNFNNRFLFGNAQVSFSLTETKRVIPLGLVQDLNNLPIMPFGEIEYDTFTLVNDPDISKYAFVYYIPSRVKQEPLVRTLFMGNAFPMHDSYEHLIEVKLNNTKFWQHYFDEYSYAVIRPFIPNIAQMLPRESMIPQEYVYELWIRPDLEMRSMIEHFFQKATEAALPIHEKVFMTGFSNGGIQANIFPILHPDLVEATAIGAPGVLIYPMWVYNNEPLPYQIGLADIIHLPGVHYSEQLFNTIDHFIFVGGNDNRPINDPVTIHRDLTDFYKTNFGETTIHRVRAYAEFLQGRGMNAEYRIYEGFGHEWTHQMIRDTFLFFQHVELSFSANE